MNSIIPQTDKSRAMDRSRQAPGAAAAEKIRAVVEGVEKRSQEVAGFDEVQEAEEKMPDGLL